MAYIVNKTDGSVLTNVADGSINTTSTNLALIGKNYAGYGESINENFVKLLENFSSASAPGAPLTGQLWWDKQSSVLKVYDNGWKRTGGATSSAQEPTGSRITGDFWWDTSTNQLKIYTGTEFLLVGPQGGGGTTGESGSFVTTILDNALPQVEHVVVRIVIEDSTVAYYSKDAEFIPASAIPGFTSIKPGVNLSSAVSNNRFNGNLFGTVTNTGSNSLGSLAVTSTTESESATTGAFRVAGGVGIVKNLNVGGNINITSGTASTSTTTGALTVSGGMGITGSAYIASNALITGNVGIGTSTPANKFVVSDSGARGIEIIPASNIIQSFNRSTTLYDTMRFYAQDLVFRTGTGSSITEDRVYITSSGYVGIGTNNPGYNLHVRQVSGEVVSAVSSNGSTGTDVATFYSSAGSTSAQVTTYGSGFSYFTSSASQGVTIGNSANAAVQINTNNTSRIYITGAGNVGIGTDNPETKFHVSSGATDEVARFEGTGSPYISLYDSGTRDFYLLDSTEIQLWGQANKAMSFATNNTYRMQITSDGNLLIGTSVNAANGLVFEQDRNIAWQQGTGESVPNIFRQTGSGALTLGYGVRFRDTVNLDEFTSSYGENVGKSAITVSSGEIVFRLNSASIVAPNSPVSLTRRMDINSAGTLSVTGDVVAFTASDARLKTEIKNITNALEKVSKLNGVEFYWNDQAREIYPERTQQDVGVIAQEVQEVLPEIVTERDNGYLAVKYEKLVPLLIEAIKELKLEIQELKSKLS
jgi:hypothetical protein